MIEKIFHHQAGVMGWPIEHSLSPRLHGFWLRKYGIDGNYSALSVTPERLEEALRALPAKGFCGVNLTVPHKEAALKIVDHKDLLADRIGAVNTVIVRRDGTLEGRNTDAYGFTQNLLAAGIKSNDRPAVLLGAGGAARAALVALLDMGFVNIHILNRTQDRAEMLAEHFSTPKQKVTTFAWDKTQSLKGAGLLINATSLGLQGQPPLSLRLDDLPLDAWVTDMVYAPLMTDLLLAAEKRGNKVCDGLGMLLHQARPAFAAFYGVEPLVTPDLRAYVLEGRV